MDFLNDFDDWTEYYDNVPPEVLALDGTLSKVGTIRTVYDKDELVTEIHVAERTRTTIKGITISSISKCFSDFSKIDLFSNDSSSHLIEQMLEITPDIDTGLDVDIEDRTASECDYAILNDPDIQNLVILDPSPGTVFRTEKMAKTKTVYFAHTPEYSRTVYFDKVLKALGNTQIFPWKAFENQELSTKNLYIGFNGNALPVTLKRFSAHMKRYKNVYGWSINPFSSYSAHKITNIAYSLDSISFEFQRKGYRKFETYNYHVDHFRYSARGSIDYIIKHSQVMHSRDTFLLVSREYVLGLLAMNDLDDISPLYTSVKENVLVPPFGHITAFFDGDQPVDLLLPMKYFDRVQYVSTLINNEFKPVWSKRKKFTSTSIDLHNSRFHMGNYYPIVSTVMFPSNRKYPIANDTEVVIGGQKCIFKYRDKGVYVQSIGNEEIYYFREGTITTNVRSKLCRIQDGSLVGFPIDSEGETYLCASSTIFTRPPNYVKWQRSSLMPAYPYHYNDFMAGTSEHMVDIIDYETETLVADQAKDYSGYN